MAHGFLKHTKWKETTLTEISAKQKISKVTAEFKFTGDLRGWAMVEYLMYYRRISPKNPHRNVADYVGLFRFHGTLEGKRGTFVMMDKGVFENGRAHSDLKILSGSGTGSLTSISGSGSYVATKQLTSLELNYVLLKDKRLQEHLKAA